MAKQDGKSRAFISVELPEGLQAALRGLAAGAGVEGLRPERQGQIHLTLLFLGEVDARQLESVRSILSSFDHAGFKVSLRGLGTFLKHGRGVLYAEVAEGAPELRNIHAVLRERITAAGVRLEEREFAPHVTIARVRGLSGDALRTLDGLVARHKGAELGSFTCRALALKRSELLPGGAVHTVLYQRDLS